MGAKWLAEQIENSPRVSGLTVESDRVLSFAAPAALLAPQEQVRVYMPTREEYEVGQEVIDKAASLGATDIVCDSWVHGGYNGAVKATDGTRLRIHKVGRFISQYAR